MSSSRRPSALILNVTSYSPVLRCADEFGVFTQPRSLSNRLIVGCGPIPSSRRPTSSTPAATARLTSSASRTLIAFIGRLALAHHRRHGIALVAQVEHRLGDLLLRPRPHDVV